MLQTADLIAWSIRVDLERLGSPVLKVLRDPERIGGSFSRIWNASALAQFVIDIEAKVESN